MPSNRHSSRETRPAATSPLPALVTDVLPLGILALALFYSNRWFTIVDDEAIGLNLAAQPLRAILAQAAAFEKHSPLFGSLMHVWLLLTGGAFDWLRVPATVFFIAGLWMLSRAALRLGGGPSATALVWLGALWPYGFHFGRLAAWYSFVFLCTSAVTWAYLRFCDSPSRSAWALVLLLCGVLVYASYFGWALLVLLGVDDWVRHRAQPGAVRRLAGSAALLAIAYAPLWPALLRALQKNMTFHHSWRASVLNLGFNIYVLLVSESVAPWFWRFGIPATLAVAASLLLVFFGVRREARRFLLFGASLATAMAAIGILDARRMTLAAPWFLLPIAVAVGAMEGALVRRVLAVSLLVAAGIGWYGITVRRFYAAPRYLEPWPTVAAEAAEAFQQGSGVIGNNPSFFFYLTYQLQVPPAAPGSRWRFSGSLPEGAHSDGIWDGEQWIEAGKPLRPAMLWVRGMPGPEEGTPLATAASWLDQHCGNRTERLLMRDPGYDWKQRYFPESHQLFWRAEIRQYECAESPAPPAATSPNSAR